ncbi:hypothetical protein GJAV_G00264070 [Gymnothorax javanicus]|nr:hypothetical protein GJAV_G00264070 [Gymnothorax javanicus]
MKKKSAENKEPAEVPEQNDGYVVGQISGSLFPKKSTSGASHLASLFNTESSASSVLFVPAPKPVAKATEKSSEDPEPARQIIQTPKKEGKKKKSAAEEKLESRESALQNADEEDGVKKTAKKSKRKAPEMGLGGMGEGEEQGVPDRKKKAVNMAEARIKNKRTVFVGNLPVSCSKKALQILFRELGRIESIRFRSVMREDPSMSLKVATIQRKVHPKRQSINAYVVFKSEEEAEKALERNGLEIEKGFHIRVDRASKSASHDHKRSIFVGNLPYDINELPLRTHFEDCGKVEAVRLVRDRRSGMGKGFGYVLFESADAVQLALKLDGLELDGRKVRVKRSVKKEKVKNRSAGRGPKTGATKGPRKGDTKKTAAVDSGKSVTGARREPKVRQGKGPQGKPSAGLAQRPLGRPHSAASFKGEMATPGGEKGKKSKALKKKKVKERKGKTVHI